MGNVLVHFSHQRMCDQLALVSGEKSSVIRDRLFETGLQAEFERGQIDESEYCNRLLETTDQQLDINRLRAAGSDIFSLNDPMPGILDSLREQGLRLVLMSNTSVWHYDWVRESYNVLDRFDEIVTSYGAGAIKPEPGIYEEAIKTIACSPEECFYTDDIPEYVEVGRQFGFQAEVFTEPVKLLDHLSRRGIDLD
jgi:putative hydrolase of the HAD superfamily